MEAFLHDWLSLLLRWAHFITGVAWIGASFYFNWLENHLERQNAASGVAGDLWAVHGGGFYYLQKYEVAPDRLPPVLHWFKYEAYFTWITGFALLCVVYYWNGAVYLIDRTVADLSAWQAVLIGLASMLLSWLFYDGVCRSPLRKNSAVLALSILAWFAALAWLLSGLFSGRGAYIHVGAAIGSVMVANVFFVIIPAQRELVAALSERRSPDPHYGRNALMRSRHNNYFTLPVLFIMISNHYGGTYGHPWNWLVLVVFSLAAVGVRHWFNQRHLPDHKRWVLPVSALLMGGLILALMPRAADREVGSGDAVATFELMPVIAQRCSSCHAAKPSYPGFSAAPLGVELDSQAAIEAAAERIYQSTVVTRVMPLGNITGMSDEERELIARWYAGFADSQEEHASNEQ
jgi:uncharacterized membrane protein